MYIYIYLHSHHLHKDLTDLGELCDMGCGVSQELYRAPSEAGEHSIQQKMFVKTWEALVHTCTIL